MNGQPAASSQIGRLEGDRTVRLIAAAFAAAPSAQAMVVGATAVDWHGDVSQAAPVVAADAPGRWPARRTLPEEQAPLVTVVGAALSAAGWWTRGGGEPVRGGLVVASSSAPVVAAQKFCEELRSGADVIAPSSFIHALPSTAASMLGLLFGLLEYQATVVGGDLAGCVALCHGLDRLRLGRLDRLVVAALSVGFTEDSREAAAFCLSTEGGEAPVVDCTIDRATNAASSSRHSSAPLVEVASRFESWSRGDQFTVMHQGGDREARIVVSNSPQH